LFINIYEKVSLDYFIAKIFNPIGS
jgi:hypothetical protein